MTMKEDLKKRVRERQARTGESYTAARGQVLAHREEVGSEILMAMADLSAEAQGLGLTCRRAYASPRVIERIDGVAMLAQLRAALLATLDDTATELLRSVLLAGARPSAPPPSAPGFIEVRRFVARVQAGIGGMTGPGTMLSLQVRGRRGPEVVVCILRLMPDPVPELLRSRAEEIRERLPSLLVCTADDLADSHGFFPWY
jgi:hypothetical protein